MKTGAHMSKRMRGTPSSILWTSSWSAWGGGPALLGLSGHLTFPLCLSPLSPIPNCLSLPFKFSSSLSFSHSASDDDAQSGIRKFRQNCSFLLLCTVLSIMKLQVVFSIILPVLAMTIRHNNIVFFLC